MKKPSIKDVAALAGVSPTTVSQVLNKRNDHFPPETVARVMAAQQELGYVPNQSAKSLRGNANPMIGVLVPSLRNPFFADLMQSMQAHAHGIADLIFFSAADDEIEQGILTLIGRGVNGLVIARMLPNALDVADYLAKQHVPYVVLDQTNSEAITDSVKTEEYQGGQAVAEHLLALGHQKLAVVKPDLMTENMQERFNGFMESLPVDVTVNEFKTRLSKHGGLAISHRVADSLATAVFVLNDEMAIGVLRGLKDSGIQVPEQISVVGYDNTDYAEFTVPSLTTVTQPVWRMGQVALDMILARLKDPTLPQQVLRLETKLIVRESTANRITK